MFSKKKTEKIKTVTVTDLQRKVGLITNDVAINRNHVIVERNGYPVAAVIPISDYEKLTKQSGKSD